jgi:hypothetical protein
VHSAASPHRVAAASLLLRLLKLSPREIAPPSREIASPAHAAPAAALDGTLSTTPSGQEGGSAGQAGGADSGAVDPRAEWPMAPLHALLRYVEWHAQHGGSAGAPLVSSASTRLLPHEIQLYAELVAHAQLRSPAALAGASQQWVRGGGPRLGLGLGPGPGPGPGPGLGLGLGLGPGSGLGLGLGLG